MSTIPRDILGGRPAKPDTIVPGYWVLPFPSPSDRVPTIRVRRFAAKGSKGNEGRKAVSASDVWEKLAEDPLDRAWRDINSSRASPALGSAVDGILGEKLATIANSLPLSSEGGENAEGKVGSRELWCFALETHDGSLEMSETDGLEEILPSLGPLAIADYLSCKTNDDPLSCLSDASSEVAFSPPSPEMAVAWTHLTNAVVERMAWNSGRRVSILQDSASYVLLQTGRFFANPSASPFKATLRPYTSSSLLLTVTSAPLPTCKPGISPLTGPQPALLLPLRLPAITLSAFHPTPAQVTHLTNVFDEALGPKWREGTRGAKLRASISNRPWSDWTVLWVPSLSTATTYSTSTAAEVVGQWQRGEGILTIWPTHLVHDLAPASPFVSGEGNSRKRKADSSIAFGAPIPRDILGWSANVFEVMGAYKEPPPPPPPDSIPTHGGPLRLADLTPEERFDVTSPAEPIAEGDDAAPEEAGSDLEDLFSSDSSPAPSSPVIDKDANPDTAVGNINLDDLFEAPLAEPQPMQVDQDLLEDTGADGEYANGDGGFGLGDLEAGGDLTLITEDDFDFFDSPNQALDVSEAAIDVAVVGESPEAVEPVELIESDPPAIEEAAKDDSAPIAPLEPDADVGGGATTPVPPTGDVSTVSVDLQENGAPDEEAEPPPEVIRPRSPPTSPFTSTLPAQAAPSPPRKRRAPPTHDLIPASFEPLPLQSNHTDLLSLSYLPPSPAPTPGSLRGELIERLKPPKSANVDYASSWRFEDDSSVGEPDEEEGEYSGAPPTPSSSGDWDPDSRTSVHDGSERRIADGDEIVLYGGTRCVGGEWVSLAGEPTWRDALERGWSNSWGKAQPATTVSPTVKREKEELEGLDVDRLALEIVWNAHFRKMLLPKPSMDFTSESPQDGIVEFLKSGVAVSELSAPLENADQRKRMPECNIHAGLNNNVLRVGIGALGYWKQLGLGPVGGRKDIVPVVLCEASESSKRAALTFLQSMAAVYDGFGLGKQDPVGGWDPAVVGIPAEDFPKTLETYHQKMLSLEGTGDERYHIIFVLFNEMTAAISPSALQLLFASSGSLARPTSGLHLIQVVSASSIHPSGLADLAFGIYNRFPRQVNTIEAHGHPVDETPRSMQFPAWTLAQDSLPKVEFSLSWPLRSNDMLNRWRWSHAAYSISTELGVVVAVVVDSEGENLELKTWRTSNGKTGELDAGKALEEVWHWLQDVAQASAVEWRMSITRMGAMTVPEYDTWRKLICGRHAPVSLLVIDPPRATAGSAWRPKPPLSNITPAIFNDAGTRLHDDTLTAYSAPLSHRLAVTLPTASAASAGEERSVYAQKSFFLSLASPLQPADFSSALYHILSSRSPPSREEKVEDVLAREFQKLAVLGRLRFGFEQGAVPAHVEAVRSIVDGLEFIGRRAE